MISRQFLFVLVIGLCIVNGLFSPYLQVAVPVTTVLLPELFPKTVHWVLMFSSILVSTATLLGSGVPAALWERLAEGDVQSRVSMWIWLAGAALLTFPAAQVFLRP
ncbi:hypothetical protein [Shumkonia mesophila]|uniref:hypothetical protein n=1 Tax=Shumkonia mesophila TaxID=2838854 RepID=UPI0029343C89|nr:hypothetical protein [Shumkonia mesophila]